MPRRSPSELAIYLNQVAERERQKQAPAEMAVRDQLVELAFEWQSPMIWHTKNMGYGGAVFDFYHSGALLVVEIDDNSHKQRKERDRRRDTRFGVEGLTTIRFSNKRALRETANVIAEIKQHLDNQRSQP